MENTMLMLSPSNMGAIRHHLRLWFGQPSPEAQFIFPFGSRKRFGLNVSLRPVTIYMQAKTKLMTSLTWKEKLILKKSITLKPCVQIKFRLHHHLSYYKIFKTRPHLTMFAWYFFKNIFLIWNNYFQLLGTNILKTRTNDYFLRTKN